MSEPPFAIAGGWETQNPSIIGGVHRAPPVIQGRPGAGAIMPATRP